MRRFRTHILNNEFESANFKNLLMLNSNISLLQFKKKSENIYQV